MFAVRPVNKENMNYTSAAIGVIGLISLVTWITTGRKHFTGPLTAVVAVHGEGSVTRSGSLGDTEENEKMPAVPKNKLVK